jgi:hypothetical protein
VSAVATASADAAGGVSGSVGARMAADAAGSTVIDTISARSTVSAGGASGSVAEINTGVGRHSAEAAGPAVVAAAALAGVAAQGESVSLGGPWRPSEDRNVAIATTVLWQVVGVELF